MSKEELKKQIESWRRLNGIIAYIATFFMMTFVLFPLAILIIALNDKYRREPLKKELNNFYLENIKKEDFDFQDDMKITIDQFDKKLKEYTYISDNALVNGNLDSLLDITAIKHKMQAWIDSELNLFKSKEEIKKIFEDISIYCNKNKHNYYEDDFVCLTDKIEKEKERLLNSSFAYKYTYEEIYKNIFKSEKNIIPTIKEIEELRNKIADANQFQNKTLMDKCLEEKSKYNTTHMTGQDFEIKILNVERDPQNIYSYKNRCWNCKHSIEEHSHSSQYCPICKHYRCRACGACFCGKPRYK